LEPSRRPIISKNSPSFSPTSAILPLKQLPGRSRPACGSDGPYATALETLSRVGSVANHGACRERIRADLESLSKQGSLQFIPHEGWLSTSEQFRQSDINAPPWKMDTFYRFIRRTTAVLMEGEKPVGGKYSFDVRTGFHAWQTTFTRTALLSERPSGGGWDLIGKTFTRHPGQLNLDALPPPDRMLKALVLAKAECLLHFGPYEDAMSHRSEAFSHSHLILVNIHRLCRPA